jgi:hypothetical protein
MKKRGESIKAKEAVRGKWADHGHADNTSAAQVIVYSCIMYV